MRNEILKKYSSSPTVFVLETPNFYSKDKIVNYSTKYGKQIELVIYKLVFSKNGLNYYSYIRSDGLDRRTILQNKIEKRKEWADKSTQKSDKYWKASQEGREFLSLAEPIKVGHHSENKHRNLIEKNWNRLGKSVEFDNKAKDHEDKASNIEEQLKSELPIDNPNCLEPLNRALEMAKEKHLFYKNNPEKREHSFSLTYAKKKVNDLEKRLATAKKLWEI